jgi:hypothetical protein
MTLRSKILATVGLLALAGLLILATVGLLAVASLFPPASRAKEPSAPPASETEASALPASETLQSQRLEREEKLKLHREAMLSRMAAAKAERLERPGVDPSTAKASAEDVNAQTTLRLYQARWEAREEHLRSPEMLRIYSELEALGDNAGPAGEAAIAKILHALKFELFDGARDAALSEGAPEGAANLVEQARAFAVEDLRRRGVAANAEGDWALAHVFLEQARSEGLQDEEALKIANEVWRRTQGQEQILFYLSALEKLLAKHGSDESRDALERLKETLELSSNAQAPVDAPEAP